MATTADLPTPMATGPFELAATTSTTLPPTTPPRPPRPPRPARAARPPTSGVPAVQQHQYQQISPQRPSTDRLSLEMESPPRAQPATAVASFFPRSSVARSASCCSDPHSDSDHGTLHSVNSVTSSSQESLDSQDAILLTPASRAHFGEGTPSAAPPKMTVPSMIDTSIGRTPSDEQEEMVWPSSASSSTTPISYLPMALAASTSRMVSTSSKSVRPRARHFASAPVTPRSTSPEPYLARPEQDPRPSICVTESSRGVPQLSFLRDEKLFGMARGRADTPSADSNCTITPPPDRSIFEDRSSPSAGSRKRRLNALRRLVANLDFSQPWSVTERPERPVRGNNEDVFGPTLTLTPPQLDRLSLGGSFNADDVNVPNNDSNASLPQASGHPGTWPRNRRYSKSMVSLVDAGPSRLNKTRRALNIPDHSALPSVPPRSSSRAVSTMSTATIPYAFENQTEHLIQIVEPLRVPVIGRKTSTLRKSASQRSLPGPPRDMPVPRQRKESFGLVYSGYSKSLQHPSTSDDVELPTSWRQSLVSDELYHRVANGPDGAMELKRQEIMWEMCQTESAFVTSCRDVIRLFVAPLRQAHGGWMEGLPAGVCSLFDALEGIHEAHAELSTAQGQARCTSEVLDTAAFIAQFGAWVPRLTIHQQYITLFNSVVTEVEDAARDERSIFGEFLRLQTRDKALGSLSLGSMLLKPIQRLTKYTLFLKRLLTATPAEHDAHAALVELINNTEAVIGHLEACKAREDDFVQLSALVKRLDGVPVGFDLAVRGRRLLGHAQVVRIHRDPPSYSRTSSRRSLKATLSSVSNVRLSQASIRTGSSRGSSTDTEQTPPVVRPGFTTTPSSAASSIRSMSRTTSPNEPSLSRSTSCASSLRDNGRPPVKMGTIRKQRREDPVTMLVFSDLVAFVTPVADKNIFKTSRSDAPARLRVHAASGGGFGAVDDVREIDNNPHSRAFALAVRAPDGVSSVATYSLAPPSSPPRSGARAQPNPLSLPGTSFASFDALVSAIQEAGPSLHEELEEDVYDDDRGSDE